jgi:hypothetical protein
LSASSLATPLTLKKSGPSASAKAKAGISKESKSKRFIIFPSVFILLHSLE